MFRLVEVAHCSDWLRWPTVFRLVEVARCVSFSVKVCACFVLPVIVARAPPSAVPRAMS